MAFTCLDSYDSILRLASFKRQICVSYNVNGLSRRTGGSWRSLHSQPRKIVEESLPLFLKLSNLGALFSRVVVRVSVRIERRPIFS